MRILQLLLVTVCMLVANRQALAMRPQILDMPSPVIGSAEPITGGGVFSNFVYYDALDLNLMATDDLTAPANLMWTYTGSGANGNSNYLINGVSPINLTVTDPTSPTTPMIINRNDLDPVAGKDSLKNTITIRNKALSPIASAGINPGVMGIVPSQIQPVTFFCSDGNSFSSETVFFYTDNGGSDRLSSGCIPPLVRTDKIPTPWPVNPGEWAPGGTNHITSQQGPGGRGVCLVGTLTGDNYGSVISAYPYFNLAVNQVYRIRMKMVTSQSSAAKMPLWDVVLENYDPLTAKGLNLYINDLLCFANEGSANALDSTERTVTWFWTPPAVATPQWNHVSNGAFTAARDASNDPRLRFRMMDVDSVVGAQSNLKEGAVCIQEIEIASSSYQRAMVTNNLVNITSLADHGTTGGNVECFPLLAGTSSVTFAGGALTISPADPAGANNGALLNLTEIRPASDATFSLDPYDPKSQDNFPIAWKTGKILRLQVDLSAPSAADEASPWDALCLMFNTMTNEINADSYQTSRLGIGSPKVGTPQTYTMFFYSGIETKSIVSGFHRLRWQVRFMNSDLANFPNGQTTNTGAVTVHGIRVDEVMFN